MTSKKKQIAIMDANEACADVAFRLNEVCCIYPITPSSSMAELADQWSNQGRVNIWGQSPTIAEMQSEGGAAGALHGSLQTGALTTTFTASQGLMLMLPNMYKIAGELTSAVVHVAARSLAAQALSIFGDHQDVMAARTTGFALLASNSVQEAHDLALIAQAATLEARIPFIHFFDGFRTSHELKKMTRLSDDDLKAMIDDSLVRDHRGRGLNPDNPFIRGTAQNPDVYFQGRETVNPFYLETPAIVEKTMNRFAEIAGRQYQLFEYAGPEDATSVIVVMGSASETVKETVAHLAAKGEKVGMIQVRLFRPFSCKHLLDVIPETVRSIAVLDRTKEPGATGEPLYLDVVTAMAEALAEGNLRLSSGMPKIIGGRYGLSSKEFTPSMVKSVFAELDKPKSKNHFTIGIKDDVTDSSLDYDAEWEIESDDLFRGIFFGLGSDGTVGANKNSIKIIGDQEENFVQGYFVYDSKKSGSMTESHLRFGHAPIGSPYLIQAANFIGVHQFNFMDKVDVLKRARNGTTLLLNSPYDASTVWEKLPGTVQKKIIDLDIKVYVIDALKVAQSVGMGRRINTIMQCCFFALANVIDKDQAINEIKDAIRKTYGKKGEEIVKRNYRAVDASLENLFPVSIPTGSPLAAETDKSFPQSAPKFVREVTAAMLEGRGDDLPVSAMPIDGTYPSGTTAWEKRNVSQLVPVWDSDVCIQCGNCSFVCPHSVIRAKTYHQSKLDKAPTEFRSAPVQAKGAPDTRYTLQVYLEDCTGCGLCVEACPAINNEVTGRKAINLEDKDPILDQEVESISFFESIEENERARVDFSSVRGVQFLEPLFEFPGACSGCGETPYIKLLTQLFGDRLMVANATGCSSIYGGNLPTTPWTKNHEGRGPAWSNSLFEDNAEFGFGFRLASDKQLTFAHQLLKGLEGKLGKDLVDDLIEAPQIKESDIRTQRQRVEKLKAKLATLSGEKVESLLSVIDQLVRRSVWIVGGDGWAYDIGSAGLDHVLASGLDVNILVLDTEVYSNTGGQSSKATPLGAVAKFAAGGKRVGKKDLALQAISYGNVYVARVALGANPQQTLLAFREAEAYKGPSIILAYSHCIAHGIAMQDGLSQQSLAVESGYWPLVRYNPELKNSHQNAFMLDSPRPRIKFKEYANNELRYRILSRVKPAEAGELMRQAQQEVNKRWDAYEKLAQQDSESVLPKG